MLSLSLLIGLTASWQSGGSSLLAPDALRMTPVAGLERTSATAAIVPIAGKPFPEVLKVQIGRSSEETNATQLTLLNTAPIARGDLLLASFWFQGTRSQGQARIELLFERATSPWTKSITRSVVARSGGAWRRVEVPFTSAEAYQPGEAMLSFRMAFGPQTVRLGGVRLENYGSRLTLDQLYDRLAASSPQAPVVVQVNRSRPRQVLQGMGGNFCQPRYGSKEAMDAVGGRLLDRLDVRMARIGVPLNYWAPEPSGYVEEGQARASFQAMQIMKRKGIPIIASVWEGPGWMLGGQPEQMGRVLPESQWKACIEALGEYFRTAKEHFGVQPDYFSFNEPDYGVNFRFTPQMQARFVREASRAWKAKGLSIKFLIGDTANGASLAPYAEYLMAQPDLQPVLGPLAYHTWDVLSAPDEVYARIAELGRRFKKPVWATEAGHDAQLWQRPNPWASWENALGLARAYARSYRLSGAERLDYWTYQDNYTLLDPQTLAPLRAFDVMKRMEAVFARGRRLIESSTEAEGLEHAASRSGTGVRLLLANAVGRRSVRVNGLQPGVRVRVETLGPSRPDSSVSARADRSGTVLVSLPTRGVVFLAAE